MCLLFCRPYDWLAKLASHLPLSGSLPFAAAFNGYRSGAPSRLPCGSLSGSLLPFALRRLFGGGASSRVIIPSFNQTNIPGYFLALAGASLRKPISLKIFRILRTFPFSTFCYNIDKNTQHFLGCPDNIGLLRVLLNSDPSVMRILRSVRFGLQIN